MTKLTDKACKKHDLLFSEGIALVTIGATTDETYKSLVNKGLITKANGTLQSLNRKYSATEKGINLADELIADSEEDIVIREDSIKELADKLREIYPEGKMPGTSYYYRGNKADIVRKLKSFFRRYGDYTFEQVIEATQRYVSSFNGNYTYLRLLKYFIWKDERKMDSEGNNYISENSDLATFIENAGQEQNLKHDWMSNIV